MKKTVTIQATNLDMTPAELRSLLPSESLTMLEGKKLHPFVIGETGPSRPRDLGSGGNLRLNWPKRAIQALRRAVKKATKLFVGHGAGTNSHDGRKEVGSVLETIERVLPDGRTQAIALTELSGDQPDLDVCSIEANVEIDDVSGDVTGVDAVTAIALGSSAVDSPAFPGAQRLASLQCFGDNPEEKPEEKAKEKRSMTYAEVKAGVEELGLAPHRLFTADQIREDSRLMKDLSSESTKEIEDLRKERDDLKTANEDLTAKVKEGDDARKQVALSGAKKKLEEVLPEGTTDRQKKFLLDEFRPEGEDDLTEESLKSYVENGTKRFAELAKMFGDESSPTGGGKDDGSHSDEAGSVDELLEALG